MRTFTSILAVVLFALAAPAHVEAKIALNRAIVGEVHLPGSAKGMKHGAVTLVMLVPGVKKGKTITTPLTANTQMTRLVEKERDKIDLKDLKPGMIAVIWISGNRGDNKNEERPQGWQLDALHVLGKSEEVDPALLKILGQINQSTYVRVTKVGSPLPEYKDDVGRVEVILDNNPFILRVTKRTEIVWQSTDAKRTPATLEDIKTIDPDIDVAIFYPALLAFGEPPVAPVSIIMLDPRAKKPQIVGVWEWQREWHGLWSFARRTGPARFEFTKDGKIKTSDNVEGTYEIAGDVLKGKLGEKAIALKIMRIDNEALVLYEGKLGVADGRDRFSMRWFKKK